MRSFVYLPCVIRLSSMGSVLLDREFESELGLLLFILGLNVVIFASSSSRCFLNSSIFFYLTSAAYRAFS